jgi:hypothetical protein
MDSHFSTYFHEFSEGSPMGAFHSVIALHEAPDISWRSISKKVPALPKAWFELAQLPREDRIEFLHEFWQSKMIYHPNLSEFLKSFFGSLDDIGIFITQKKYEDPLCPQIVYSIEGDVGFYRGAPPASEEVIAQLQGSFPEVILPKDFLTFLQIHNGFYKTTDCTGLTTAEKMRENYLEFQREVSGSEPIFTQNNKPVDPTTLYPFYKSFGLPDYQCFWADWYPENEMGVVYYSGVNRIVSDVSDGGMTIEHLCFPTFTDWLIFYLERVPA